MRAVLFAPLIVAIAPAFGFAQSSPYAASVTDIEVKLRAGPSDKYPITGSLGRGAFVVIDHDEPAGWVAIRPPTGSVSWVPSQFVEGFDTTRQLPQNVHVRCEGEITLAAGQIGVPQPLEIRKANVPDGTILAVIGSKVTYQNKTWYPVTPPEGDFRYVPRTSLRAGSAMTETYTVAGSSSAKPNPPAVPPSPTLSLPGGGTPSASTPDASGTWSRPGGVNNPLWTQAEQAEAAGRLDEAERLFFELARKMNEAGGDHDIANQCYTRIHSLREKKRLNQPQGTSTPSTTSSPPPPATRSEDRGGYRTAGTTSRERPSTAASLPPAAEMRDRDRERETDGAGKWSGPGFLIRTGYSLDGKTTYALESSPRTVKFYAVEGSGVELKKYLNKKVDLYGVVTTRRDVSQPCITVTSVEPVP